MSWTCPRCAVLCGEHRRKCTTYNCRTANPNGKQDDSWACSGCGFATNFSSKDSCHRCGMGKAWACKDSPQPKAKARPQNRAGSSVSTALTFADAVKKEVDKAKGVVSTIPSPSAHVAVQPAPSTPAAVPEQTSEEKRKQVSDKIAAATKLMTDLEAMQSADPAIAELIVQKTKDVEYLKEQLRAMRPISVQAKVAVENRDKAVKAHSKLQEEVESLADLIKIKKQQLAKSKKEAEAAQAEVDAIAERQRLQNLQVLTGNQAPSSLLMPSPSSPAQWAAGFQACLPKDVACSFQLWMSSVQANSVAPLQQNTQSTPDQNMTATPATHDAYESHIITSSPGSNAESEELEEAEPNELDKDEDGYEDLADARGRSRSRERAASDGEVTHGTSSSFRLRGAMRAFRKQDGPYAKMLRTAGLASQVVQEDLGA